MADIKEKRQIWRSKYAKMVAIDFNVKFSVL